MKIKEGKIPTITDASWRYFWWTRNPHWGGPQCLSELTSSTSFLSDGTEMLWCWWWHQQLTPQVPSLTSLPVFFKILHFPMLTFSVLNPWDTNNIVSMILSVLLPFFFPETVTVYSESFGSNFSNCVIWQLDPFSLVRGQWNPGEGWLIAAATERWKAQGITSTSDKAGRAMGSKDEIRATALSRKLIPSERKEKPIICQTDLSPREILLVPKAQIWQVTKVYLPNYQTLFIHVDTNDAARSTPKQIDEKWFCKQSWTTGIRTNDFDKLRTGT